MSIFNKVLDVMGLVEPVDDEEQAAEAPAETQRPRGSVVPLERPEQRGTAARGNTAGNNLVAFQQKELTVLSKQNKENVKVVLKEPALFDEAQSIADNLLHDKAVIINIENCDPDVAAKIIDFIGGVVYAIDGSIQKVSQGIILAAPANIDIASELKEHLSGSDEAVFSWVTRYNQRGDF